MWVAFVIILVPLGFVLVTVISKGASIISWQFLTNGTIPPNVMPAGFGGMGAGGRRHARDHRPRRAHRDTARRAWRGLHQRVRRQGHRSARFIAFMADVMTGVPSIVMGLFIYTIWVLHYGYSGMAGSFALACLMLPIVIRSSYEMLRLVPDSLREGSYALGATKARVTLTVVLPAAIGGIVSGALLAVARAAGETAPLLFTILTVEATNTNVFSGRRHRAVRADLRERAVAVRRRGSASVGRGAYADRDRIHPDDRGPHRYGPVHPLLALGIPWKSNRISCRRSRYSRTRKSSPSWTYRRRHRGRYRPARPSSTCRTCRSSTARSAR